MKVKYYQITELNTRKKTFENDLKDIFEGDDYKTHKIENFEEAKMLEKELNDKGIKTNFAKVLDF